MHQWSFEFSGGTLKIPVDLEGSQLELYSSGGA
jgi:hypothetical protein